jgi:hypothetical protein
MTSGNGGNFSGKSGINYSKGILNRVATENGGGYDDIRQSS